MAGASGSPARAFSPRRKKIAPKDIPLFRSTFGKSSVSPYTLPHDLHILPCNLAYALQPVPLVPLALHPTSYDPAATTSVPPPAQSAPSARHPCPPCRHTWTHARFHQGRRRSEGLAAKTSFRPNRHARSVGRHAGFGPRITVLTFRLTSHVM